MREKRLNLVSLVIGRRGSGKTTFLREGIAAYPKKVLIVDTLDHPAYKDVQVISPERLKYWESGTVRVFGSDFKRIFSNIKEHCRNCLIIFEDSTKYLRRELPDDVRNYIIDTKQLNVDLIFTFHGFGMVMPDLYRLSDAITIFKVGEDIATYKGKISNFGEVHKAYLQVMKESSQYANKTVLLY